MVDNRNIAGVILAGGRSSRMGRNKALLEFNGRPLVDHMIELLQEIGLVDIFVSGTLDGYNCVPDSTPYDGPAAAIRDTLCQLHAWQGVLFIPVDMPFLTPEILRYLLARGEGAHYEGWPLPLYWPVEKTPGAGSSVRQVAEEAGLAVLPLSPSFSRHFLNLNTPEEWREAVRR